jgi:HEAT repeat protein
MNKVTPATAIGFLLGACLAVVSTTTAHGNLRPTPEDLLEAAGVKTTIPSMTEALEDPQQDPELRHVSAVALGRTKNPEVVPTLVAALSDPDHFVRLGAILGLQFMPDARAISDLASILDDPAQAALHEPSSNALCLIRSREATDVIVNIVLDEATDDRTRLYATRALSQCGVTVVAEQLRPLLDDSSNRELQTSAAITIAHLGDPSGVPLIMAVLEDTSLREEEYSDAGVALEHVTGLSFGFTIPDSGTSIGAELVAAQNRALAWWEKNPRNISQIEREAC